MPPRRRWRETFDRDNSSKLPLGSQFRGRGEPTSRKLMGDTEAKVKIKDPTRITNQHWITHHRINQSHPPAVTASDNRFDFYEPETCRRLYWRQMPYRLAEVRAFLRAVIADRPIPAASPSVGSASTQASASAATSPGPKPRAVTLSSI